MTEPPHDAPPAPPQAPPPPPFDRNEFRFSSEVRGGEVAAIRDAEGNQLLSYRSFASIVPIVAGLMAGIVLVTGLAATLFLIAEKRYGAAAAALILSVGFSAVIAALIPPVRVTLYNERTPVLLIRQLNLFPLMPASYEVTSGDGTTLAILEKKFLSRLGRSRWTIDAPPDQRAVAWALEESLSRALLRKIAGKFKRHFQTNIRILHHGSPVGTIIRRPESPGVFDLLELSPSATLDRRVAVALATLVLGSEP